MAGSIRRAVAVVLFAVTCVPMALADVVVLQAVQDNTLFESSTGGRGNGSGPGIYVGRTNETFPAGISLRRA